MSFLELTKISNKFSANNNKLIPIGTRFQTVLFYEPKYFVITFLCDFDLCDLYKLRGLLLYLCSQRPYTGPHFHVLGSNRHRENPRS